MTWHGVKHFKCLLMEKNSLLLYKQPKFVFWSCRTRITRETAKQILHMFSRRHSRWISRPRKRLYVLGGQMSRIVFTTCRRALSCWKIAPGMPWRKGTTSVCSNSGTYLFLLRLTSFRMKLDLPWYVIVPQIVTPCVLPLCR